MIGFIKHQYRKLTYNYDEVQPELDTNVINLFWWNGKKNIGDSLNLELIKRLSGREVRWVPHRSNLPYYTAVGSVVQLANDKATLWGSGLISRDARPVLPPREILAVRGPLTKNRLEELGLTVPSVYGDPALLLPRFYSLSKKDVFKVGIIPHFVDKGASFFNKNFPSWVKVIDIETDDIEQFISSMLECSCVVSSSLHGLIIADAYGIPSARVKFGEGIAGGDFKFFDYFLSVKRKNFETQFVSETFEPSELLKLKFEIGSINDQCIMDSCPFI